MRVKSWCAARAVMACVALCAHSAWAQCGSGGDCCGEQTTPGCADASCCEVVCSLDSFCCEVVWDHICAMLASENCDGLCGEVAGACCIGGLCSEVLEADCLAARGIYVGDLISCGLVDCFVPTCGGDFTGDGKTNSEDLNAVLADFGTLYTSADLNAVLGDFGCGAGM